MTSVAARTLILDFASAKRVEHTSTAPMGFTALTRDAEKVLWAYVPPDAPGPVRLFGSNTSPAEYMMKYPGESWVVFENGNPTIPFYYASSDGTTVILNVMPGQ